MSGPPDAAVALRDARALRWLQVHEIAFALVILPLNVVNAVQGAPWWAFWPSFTWVVVLMVHVFIVKAMTVDEDWVDERALALRDHSYDFDHMKDIERRIVDSDFSVVPPEERERKDRER